MPGGWGACLTCCVGSTRTELLERCAARLSVLSLFSATPTADAGSKPAPRHTSSFASHASSRGSFGRVASGSNLVRGCRFHRFGSPAGPDLRNHGRQGSAPNKMNQILSRSAAAGAQDPPLAPRHRDKRRVTRQSRNRHAARQRARGSRLPSAGGLHPIGYEVLYSIDDTIRYSIG